MERDGEAPTAETMEVDREPAEDVTATYISSIDEGRLVVRKVDGRFSVTFDLLLKKAEGNREVKVDIDGRSLAAIEKYLRLHEHDAALPKEITDEMCHDASAMTDLFAEQDVSFIQDRFKHLEEPEVCDELKNLMKAADYFQIANLKELTQAHLGFTFRRLNVKEARRMLRIVNDFSPEDEKRVEEEHKYIK